MRSPVPATLACALLAMAWGPAGHADPGAFVDDFDDGDADGWVPVNGGWAVEAQEYGCAGNFGVAVEEPPLDFLDGHSQGYYNCLSLAAPASAGWLDYEARVTFFVYGPDLGGQPDHRWNAGFAMRWLDLGNHVAAWVGDDGLTLARVTAAQTTILARAPAHLPSPDGFTPLRVDLVARVEGDRITAATSTGLEVEASDPSLLPDPLGRAGQFGLLGWVEPWGLHLHIDDVRVDVLACLDLPA